MPPRRRHPRSPPLVGTPGPRSRATSGSRPRCDVARMLDARRPACWPIPSGSPTASRPRAGGSRPRTSGRSADAWHSRWTDPTSPAPSCRRCPSCATGAPPSCAVRPGTPPPCSGWPRVTGAAPAGPSGAASPWSTPTRPASAPPSCEPGPRRTAPKLARLGLRLALADGKAADVLTWAERHHARSMWLPAVRPSADPELAARLVELRDARTRQREEILGGGGGMPRTDARIAALERAVQQRSRLARGDATGATDHLDLSGLRAASRRVTIVELLTVEGMLHAVVVTNGRVRLHGLGRIEPIIGEKEHLLSAMRRFLARAVRGLDVTAAATGVRRRRAPRRRRAVRRARARTRHAGRVRAERCPARPALVGHPDPRRPADRRRAERRPLAASGSGPPSPAPPPLAGAARRRPRPAWSQRRGPGARRSAIRDPPC